MPLAVLGAASGCRGELESDKKSDRGLCEVSHFVEVQVIECEIRDLVHKTAILGTHTKVVSEVEIEAATVDKCGPGLACDAIHRGQGSVRRIEDQRAGSRQRVRSNVRDLEGKVRHE